LINQGAKVSADSEVIMFFEDSLDEISLNCLTFAPGVYIPEIISVVQKI